MNLHELLTAIEASRKRSLDWCNNEQRLVEHLEEIADKLRIANKYEEYTDILLKPRPDAGELEIDSKLRAEISRIATILKIVPQDTIEKLVRAALLKGRWDVVGSLKTEFLENHDRFYQFAHVDRPGLFMTIAHMVIDMCMKDGLLDREGIVEKSLEIKGEINEPPILPSADAE